MTEGGGVTRRGFFASAAGAAGLAASGSASAAQAGGGVDFGSWFDNVSNFDGTVVDRRGQDTVEITVGASGNNGNFAFGPAAVRVDPGTTVVWKWNGKGGGHNVLAEDGEWGSGDTVSEAGTTYERTFESEGTYKYYCDPHKTLGMKGAVVVGDVGLTKPLDFGSWFDNVSNFDGTVVDRRGQESVEVTVGASGNNGNFAFGPAAVRVDPGTTVVWKWNGKGGGHNVLAENGEWGSGETVSEAGTTYERTFESEGVYEYYCDPHKTLGMKGAVVVGTRGLGAGGEAGGDLTLGTDFLLLGGSATVALLSPIAFGLLLRYRREKVGPSAETRRRLQRVEETEPPVAEEAPVETPERELGHDEYDPWGTFSLVLLYVLILVVMWVFMYFVEFLGRGPTVI